MGEAKRKQSAGADVIYHHTSTLRTNLLWMSGVILPEGEMKPVIHPVLGTLATDARFRRDMKDFPPVVWFTRNTAVPHCLLNFEIAFVKDGQRVHSEMVGPEMASALSLDRLAIGFRPSDIGAVRWQDHPGYSTGEGRELNDRAREFGDDPTHWYVVEKPVDLLLAMRILKGRKRGDPVMERFDSYLPDMKRMVTMCRETKGVYIPPTWLSEEQARKLAAVMGVPVA